MLITGGSYTRATYGDRIADLYDAWAGGVFATDDCVDRIAELAGTGRVLELGVGTGRVAVPLAERGLQVVGIDASTAMLDRLAAKYDGPLLTSLCGDFADVDVDGDFSLILVAADTLFMLTTQDEQVRCFTNAAAHLAPGGVFVVEAFVPGATRYLQGHDTAVRSITADSVLLGVATHDPVAQRLDAQQILLGTDGIRLIPGALRYAWPSELDLMARLAGLRLRDRWSDWRGGRFVATSARHISVYQRT
jgi:SAM-dependent methyltransferase